MIVKTNRKNKFEAFESLKEARTFVKRKMTWHKCYKHYYHEVDGQCDCRTYKVFTISERLLDTKESGNV